MTSCADGLIIASLKYAHGATTVIALNWLVSEPRLYRKPVLRFNYAPDSHRDYDAHVKPFRSMSLLIDKVHSTTIGINPLKADVDSNLQDTHITAQISAGLDVY